MKKLSKEQILQIPELLETRSIAETAAHLKVHVRTIGYWIARLKTAGHVFENLKKGAKAIKL